MINPGGLFWWEPVADLDIQVPYAAHAIRWVRVEQPERFGMVWVPVGTCDVDDPFDVQIAKAVLLDIFAGAYPAPATLRRRGLPMGTWHVDPVDMDHCPGLEGGIILEEPQIRGRILINHDINDPARVRSVLRWALTQADAFNPATALQDGWSRRYGKWSKTVYAHPCVRSLV